MIPAMPEPPTSSLDSSELVSPKRTLLLDCSRPVQKALRSYLEEAGFEVDVAAAHEDPVDVARTRDPTVVLAEAAPPERAGEATCSRVKAEVNERLPVVLLYAPDDDDAERRAMSAGADGYVVAPLKKHTVLTVVRDMVRIRALLDQIAALEAELASARAGGADGRTEPSRPRVGVDDVYDFDFFKKLLLMEVKRSSRYAYPISLALVAFDSFPEVTADLDATARGRLVGSLLAEITRSIRDIDIPVLYAEDKVLVFMPHTPRKGALIVGGRLRDRIQNHGFELDSDNRVRVTGSIGIASFEGQGRVSFGSLIKDATAALRQAQIEGGNTVRAAGGEGKKSRVSIG